MQSNFSSPQQRRSPPVVVTPWTSSTRRSTRSRKDAAAQLGRSGVVNDDRLGLDRIYTQAKRYPPGNPVGRPDVYGFVGSLVGLGATKDVFVTTSTFSQPARDYVKHLAQRVILIDGQELADLMIEHGVGVRSYRMVEFQRLDEDLFGEECGAELDTKGQLCLGTSRPPQRGMAAST